MVAKTDDKIYVSISTGKNIKLLFSVLCQRKPFVENIESEVAT